jgi:hypothetical protein
VCHHSVHSNFRSELYIAASARETKGRQQYARSAIEGPTCAAWWATFLGETEGIGDDPRVVSVSSLAQPSQLAGKKFAHSEVRSAGSRGWNRATFFGHKMRALVPASLGQQHPNSLPPPLQKRRCFSGSAAGLFSRTGIGRILPLAGLLKSRSSALSRRKQHTRGRQKTSKDSAFSWC